MPRSPSRVVQRLAGALLILRDEREAIAFLYDLLSQRELISAAKRWAVTLAYVESDGQDAQHKIARCHKVAPAVVNRVINRALQRGKSVAARVARRQLGR